MITEDYISFETAKLLKEKGFGKDVLITDWWYDEKGDAHKHQNYSYSGAPVYYKETCCQAPTLQMAMKWLREVHNIYIWVQPNSCKEGLHDAHVKEHWWKNTWAGIGYKSYEEAVEAAIKYCLENLI